MSNSGNWAGTWQGHSTNDFAPAGTYATNDTGATNISAGASDSYDPVTRTMTWDTNAVGGGVGTITNISSLDGSVAVTDPGGPEPDLSVASYVSNQLNLIGDSGFQTLSDSGTNDVSYTVNFSTVPFLLVQTYTGSTYQITYEVISTATNGATFVARNSGGLETNTSISVIWATAGALGTSAGVGPQGSPGANGTNGLAATIAVAWYSNGVPGSSVIVTNMGNNNAASFGFVVPVGSNGPTGSTGPAGTNVYTANVTEYFSGDTLTVSGKVYQFSSGTWTASTCTNQTTCNQLVGVALGTNSTTAGIMTFGRMAVTNTDLILGASVYVSAVGGEWTQTIPTNSGNIIRSIGYATATNELYVRPDNIWAEVK
jgi:hypothetical protein